MGNRRTEYIGQKIEPESRSLVAFAARLAGKADRAAGSGPSGPGAGRRFRRNGGANGPEAAPRQTLFDGYVRKSPVQPVREMANYRRKKVVRAVEVALLLAVLMILLWLVLQSGILAF